VCVCVCVCVCVGVCGCEDTCCWREVEGVEVVVWKGVRVYV
jgi:hypothetical protein